MRTHSTQQLSKFGSFNKAMNCFIIATILFTTTFSSQLYSQSCPNVDFSAGNFSSWTGRTGTCCPINLPTLGIVPGRHTIIAGPGVDPNTCGGLVLPAPGFTQVARLGNPVNGAEAEGLSYSLVVDPTNALFIYTYAVVLEDPGHSVVEQPRFELQVRDALNNIIPCTFYEVSAGAGIPGFNTCGGVVWKDWTQAGVDLSAYMGQTVTIEARTGDCSLGGHYGYGYIAGQCQPLTINVGFCAGANTANLSAPAGFATYLWSTGDTTQNIVINNPIVNSTVTCTITSVTGCQAVLSATLTPTTVTPTITSSTNVTCFAGNNGTATVSATGGTAPYTYAWAPSGGTAATASGLTAGNYTVTVTESSINCTATATVTISQPASPNSITATASNVLCNGGNTGSINITPVGGTPTYSFAWSNGAITEDIAGLTTGTYSVIATDINGCTATISQIVSQPATALSATATISPISCFGGSNGSIDLSPSGGTPGYNFSWSNGPITEDIGGLGIGGYTVTVTDLNGCTTNYTNTLTQPTQLSASAVVSPVICYGSNTGSIDITPSGGTPGYNYFWSTSGFTEDISGQPASTYWVIVSDANACSVTYNITIPEPAPLSVTGTSNNILCFGGNTGSIDITPNGGTINYSYLWSNGATTQDLNTLAPGYYSVMVTDANGCTNNTFSANISQPTAALSVTGINTNILCFGANTGAVDITPTGGTPGYSFAWTNGATTEDISGVPTGFYGVTLTDANGCTNNAYAALLSQPTAAISVSGTVTNVLCHGSNTGAVDITITGGTPGYNFSWSNGALTEDMTGLGAGNYNVIVTDANGCTNNSYTAAIMQPNTALAVNGNAYNPLCNSTATGFIDATTSGGVLPYNFIWSNGSPDEDLYNLVGGTYSMTVTDGNGCTTSGSWTLIDPLQVVLNPIIEQNKCYGVFNAFIDLGITGGTVPYSILWNNGATTNHIDNLHPGDYSVNVTDFNGCTATGSYSIEAAPIIYVNLDSLYTIWLGESVELEAHASGGTGSLTYSWSPPEDLTCTDCAITTASPTINTTYAVTVTDENGCTAVAGAYIDIMFALYVPNTFTPNGDGNNDIFNAVSGSVKKFNMRVFDRWGEEVFTTTNIHDGWDGDYKGGEAKQDVYVFRIEATFANGKYEEIIGQVNLLR